MKKFATRPCDRSNRSPRQQPPGIYQLLYLFVPTPPHETLAIGMHHTEKRQKQKKKPATLSHTPPSIPAEAIPLTPLSSTYRKPSTLPKLSLAAAQPRHLHDDIPAVTSTSKQTSQLPLTGQRSPHSPRLQARSRYRQHPPSTKTCRLSHPKSQPLTSMHAASRILRVPVTRPENGSSYRALLLCVKHPQAAVSKKCHTVLPLPPLMVGPPACSNGRLYFSIPLHPKTDIDK